MKVSVPELSSQCPAGNFQDGNTMRMLMAVTELESLPRPLGLLNISGCARGRNLCLPFAYPVFCLNRQILFWVDYKRGKHFKKNYLSNSVIWKEIRYLELRENSASNKEINFPITKAEDNHRPSLGLRHWFFSPLHKCSQVLHLSRLLAWCSLGNHLGNS